MILLTILAAAALDGAAPLPGAAAAPSDTIALSPDERSAALEAGAARAASELPINGLGNRVHGEMGVSVDSRGGRAVYGTTSVPIGQSGVASFSFLNENGGRWRRR